MKLEQSILKFYLIIMTGSVKLALAAYNAGIGTVNKWIDNEIIKRDGTDIEKIPYKETNNYIRKVIRNYRIYVRSND